MKIYLSGPISGSSEEEYTRDFNNASFVVENEGHVPVNPLDINACANHSCDGERHYDSSTYRHSWLCYMKHDIKALVECDGIAMLPNWMDSKGANCEYIIAQMLKLYIWEIKNNQMVRLANHFE